MIVSAPDTNGRYYLLPMLDMWTDVFASPGGVPPARKLRITWSRLPGWSGKVPDGLTQIPLPRRMYGSSAELRQMDPDYDAVHKIQAGYKVTALSLWGKPSKAVAVKIDPTVDMKTPPMVQVNAMAAGNTSHTRQICSSCIRLTSRISRFWLRCGASGLNLGPASIFRNSTPQCRKVYRPHQRKRSS